MVKNDLIRSVAAKASEYATERNTAEGKDAVTYTHKMTLDIIEAFEDVIIESLENDHEDKIQFGKLGKFVVKEVPEKSGVMNGKEWHTDAHSEICFKMSKTGKEIS